MSEKADKKEYVEQRINEADAGVYAYDKALVEDLRARFSSSPVDSQVNKNVQIGPTEQMFNIIGSLEDDNIIMPFISLERLDWQLNLDRQGFQTFVGDEVYTRLDSQNLPVEVRARAIPITINYRLSVWSEDRITNDDDIKDIINGITKYIITSFKDSIVKFEEFYAKFVYDPYEMESDDYEDDEIYSRYL